MVYQIPTLEYELLARRNGYKFIAGIDEVGRGPIAGPVVSAALVFDAGIDCDWVSDVRDSKQLSDKQRRRILDGINLEGVNHGLGIVSASDIDKMGIVPATKLSMMRAVENLKVHPDFLLIDAVDLEEIDIEQTSIIKGDQKCLSIAAASIVAKVHRDNLMVAADQEYPGYGFAEHKGYPTRFHIQKLIELGPSPIHRISFAPVRKYIGSNRIQ